MKLNSHDEWSPLREVILGTVEGFVPAVEVDDADDGRLERAAKIAARAYPAWYLDEVAEDLEGLAMILRTRGARVHRPKWSEARANFRTPNWAAAGFDHYNVRDLHVVFGDLLVSSASASRFRFFEHYSMQALVYEYFFEAGMRWIHAPPPRLVGNYVEEYQRACTSLEVEEDQRHAALSSGLAETFHRLLESEILFDAANIIRVGADILYLVSSTGNVLAGRWLQAILGEEYRVHTTSAYRSSHLDSTILPLRPGFVLLNSARVDPSNCPAIFERWSKLYFGDVAPVPDAEIRFHRDVRLPAFHELKAMGVGCNLGHMSSPWAGLNVLSLDSNTVLVHDRQEALMRELERNGFAVVPVRMRHCYSMLGGLHCATLDVVREGERADHR